MTAADAAAHADRSRWARLVRDPAVRIAAAFVTFGSVWILTSDRALSVMVRDVGRLSTLQTYKGWLFVVGTGILLYAVVRREFRARLALERERIELRERERAAREDAELAERRAMRILESITDAFYAADRDWRITYLNDKAQRHLGRPRDELIGRRLWDVFPEAVDSVFHERLREAVRTGSRVAFQAESMVNPDRWVDVRAYPTREGLAVYMTDVTERRALETQLRHAQKMEAVGRLARGLAHDFRNLLAVVSGNAKFLLDDLDDDDPCRGYAEDSAAAAERALELTRKLLVFSRAEDGRPAVMRLNEVVAEAEPVLRTAVGKRVEFGIEADPADPAVEAGPSDLDQVLLNLAVNAKDAMPDGGRFTVETGTVVVEEGTPRRAPGLPRGEYATLTVSDTGYGMDEETMERIFEPLFTTKREGQGTGLGLSTVYGIVHRLGGAIEVESRVGQGTTFRIWLPVAS